MQQMRKDTMNDTETKRELADEVKQFARRSFTPRFGELTESFASNPAWRRLRNIGTELWLDTGSLEEASVLWTREFSALTTNNTLLNQEVQTGRYDELIDEAVELLARRELSERERTLEIAFILNARHGLTLVERFDAHVSVEEHTDLAHDLEGAIDYALRYHAICPERFIIKIPFTPAGLLVTRWLSREGVPVNHTLGFSARQNYLMARIGRPAYVNVFLGRLNSFVADNALGDGSYVGEKATLASQAAIRTLRRDRNVPTKQIGASFREALQVRDLAAIDVMTIPPKVARAFLDRDVPLDELVDRTSVLYVPPLRQDVDPAAVRLDTLWDVGEDFVACVHALERENLDGFAPDDLVAFFHAHGCGDVFPRWAAEQVATSAEEGKIPKLENWRHALASRAIGLDSLMSLAGLNSFAADQKAMDERVTSVLARG